MCVKLAQSKEWKISDSSILELTEN